MAKETYYFSHDSNALTDTKILNMRADYGLEGYGLFWVIIEMMRNEEDYKLNLNKNTYRAIKTLTNTGIDVEKFINDCIEDYCLFKKEEEKFYSNSLLRRMEQKDKKSAIAREKAQKRWNSNAEAMPEQSSSNANKVNKNKNKKDQRNKIKDIYNKNCPNLPQVQKLTEKREKAIDKLLKEFSEEQFTKICQIANNTDFLIGKNDEGWKADFDFLMRTDKATNILEGKYGGTKRQANSKNNTNAEQRDYSEDDFNNLYANVGGK